MQQHNNTNKMGRERILQSQWAARIFTTILDHARFFAILWLTAQWATSTEELLLPARVALVAAGVVLSHTLAEVLYAALLEPISIHKRARVFQDIQSSAMLLYLLCLASQLCGITAIAAYFGAF
jgi:hypothetical protein